MPTINLTDTSSLTADATILDTSLLGKTPTSVLHFLRADVIGALSQTLDAVQINSLSIGFSYQPAFPLEGGTASFTAGGGITGSLALFKPAAAGSSPLFASDQYGSTIEMGRNCYLSLGFQLSIPASLTDTPGAFTLIPSVTATSNATLYLPFAAKAGAYPELKDALATLFESYVLPSSIGAMQKLPAGSVVVYDAQGSVGFNASFDLLAEVNPTASLGASQTFGPISLSAGPSVTVGGGFTLSGELQARLWNKDGKVIQLGYYKKRGSTFTVAFDASAGVTALAGSYDIIAKIYGLLGSKGELGSKWLAANVPASVADEVQAAYQAAVQTKLSIAIDQECDTTLTDQVAFSWDFDAQAMDSDAFNAFESAIRGNLSRLMSAALPTGVTKVGSVFDKLKDVTHSFTFNFLGLFDYADVQEATLHMTVKTSEEGQIVIADEATFTRLSATVTPFVKSDLLRKVLAEDFVATMGYSTALGALATNLKVQYSYYDYLRRAHSSDLETFVETAAVLADAGDPKADWAPLLQSGLASQSASLLASLAYDNATATRLFLNGGSNGSASPRSAADYEGIARKALALTPGLGLNDRFVSFLTNDAKWKQLVDAGAIGSFYAVLEVDQTAPPQWATVAYTWKDHILRWAPAMHSAAQALQEVRSYVASHPDLQPLTDAAFIQKRKTLASLLNSAVQAAPLFHDALGIITIRLAAPPASATLNISYAGKTAAYS